MFHFQVIEDFRLNSLEKETIAFMENYTAHLTFPKQPVVVETPPPPPPPPSSPPPPEEKSTDTFEDEPEEDDVGLETEVPLFRRSTRRRL